MTIEADIKRIADAFEVIAQHFTRLANPPRMFTPDADALEQVRASLGGPGILERGELFATTPPVDASQAYISGQWKRRDGHGVQQPHGQQRGSASAPLDPWVRRDVPNIEPASGQLGIKEGRNGKTTGSSN